MSTLKIQYMSPNMYPWYDHIHYCPTDDLYLPLALCIDQPPINRETGIQQCTKHRQGGWDHHNDDWTYDEEQQDQKLSSKVV